MVYFSMKEFRTAEPELAMRVKEATPDIYRESTNELSCQWIYVELNVTIQYRDKEYIIVTGKEEK